MIMLEELQVNLKRGEEIVIFVVIVFYLWLWIYSILLKICFKAIVEGFVNVMMVLYDNYSSLIQA